MCNVSFRIRKNISGSVLGEAASVGMMGRLLELSQEYDKIILVGHGVMNWLIRKELRKNGWKSDGKEVHGNWGSTILLYEVE